MDLRKKLYTAKSHFLKDLNLHGIRKVEESPPGSFTATKIIPTIGPSSHDVDMLTLLLEAGACGARVDLTWGTLDFHQRSLMNLKEASMRAKKLCCTMVDTLGPEIMVKRPMLMDNEGWPGLDTPVEVVKGQTVVLTTDPEVEPSNEIFPVTYERFTEIVSPGDTFYIARYLVTGADAASLYVEVKEIDGYDVICEAKNDAMLDGPLTIFHTCSDDSGHMIERSDMENLTMYDRECIEVLAQVADIDFLSLSFTRSAEDVRDARSFLDSIGCHGTKILAKIETRQAVLELDGILREADGIIMSRGNLGLDCPPEKTPLLQKTLIQACNLVGKPVIITRVVDSMVNNPSPTRAEATDVANAVLDGVDGIMLGAETVRGRYPVETVAVVCRTCRSAEAVFDHEHHYEVQAEAEEMLMQKKHPEKASASNPSLSSLGHPGRNGKNGLRKNAYSKLLKLDMMPRESLLATSFSHTCLNQQAEESTERKLESIASGAVRVADKVNASLILVYTHTGGTAQMIAKYRPPMPILTLVVPHVVALDGLRWHLQGLSFARQCSVVRGLVPMLAAPSSNGEQIMEEAVAIVAQAGMVRPSSNIVCVQRIHDDFCIKVISVDEHGTGIKRHSSLPFTYDDSILRETILNSMSYGAVSPSFKQPRSSECIEGQQLNDMC